MNYLLLRIARAPHSLTILLTSSELAVGPWHCHVKNKVTYFLTFLYWPNLETVDI
jgi:hypothetical protein